MPLKILNPLNIPGWDNMLESVPAATVFHTAAWAKVLQESYGYNPAYFTDMSGLKLKAFVPVMEIESRLTGKRGVSLPFTDFCAPITNGRPPFREVFESIRQHAKASGWRRIELRGGQEHLVGAPPSGRHVTHALTLGKPETELAAALRDSTRRNIKKAEKSGIEVGFDASSESLHAFYRLHCATRKRHGLPPQPFSFFLRFREHLLTRNLGVVATARYRGIPVASAVFLHFGRIAIYKYGASDPAYRNLRPNNRLMWEAIRRCNAQGFQTFHFGRTEPENEGLLQFKRGWGAFEEILNYYTYDVKQDAFITRTQNPGAFTGLFRHLPVPLLRLAGALLYRHVG